MMMKREREENEKRTKKNDGNEMTMQSLSRRHLIMTDKQRDRQTERETDKERDRQTDRQTERETHRHTDMCMCTRRRMLIAADVTHTLSLSHSGTHAHALTYSLSLTHTFSHTLALSRSLAL